MWRAEYEGTPTRMLAADGKLFIVTAEGSILAFAAPAAGDATKHVASEVPSPSADEWTEKAKAVLEATGVGDGYALVLGIDRGRLVEELVRQSNLHVIAVDDDAAKVDTLRERLYLAGLYGTRVSVLPGNPVTYPFPPYLASLVVSETPDRLGASGEAAARESGIPHSATLRRSRLRLGLAGGSQPHRGDRARRCVSRCKRSADRRLRAAGPHGSAAGRGGLVARRGRRSQHGSVGRRTPLAHVRAVVRCGAALAQVSGAEPSSSGRRVVSCSSKKVCYGHRTCTRAASCGRSSLSDEPLDRRSIRYARHREWGPRPSLSPTTELVVVEDAIYLGNGTSCQVFDPATGKPTGRIDVPEGIETPWANLRVSGDYLVGSSGRHVLCVNRRTGKLLWRVEAARAALYLAVGGNKVFCAELANPQRGEDETRDGSIFALNLATGERLWQRAGGARLRYSPLLDIVVTAAGLYRGSDGEPATAAIRCVADAAGRHGRRSAEDGPAGIDRRAEGAHREL